MKNKEIQQSIKLGIFVLVGIALFLISVVYIGSENNLFSRTFTVFAVFRNVEGLKQGDNVWLSGVKIGTVKDVKIISLGKVIVELSLRNKQNEFIKHDATASIGSDGLVGNKIVVIRPGSARTSILDNDTIGAASPTDTQDLINIAKDVGDNTRDLSENLKLIARRINDGQGLVGELLYEGNISRDIRAAIDRINATTAQTTKASAELNSIMAKLNNGDGLANRLITDTTLAQTFDQTMDNVRQVSQNTAQVSMKLEEFVEKLNNEDNAVGLLLADTTFAHQMRVTLQNAKSASAKLDENMDAVRHNFLFRGYFRRKEKEAQKNN